MRRLGAVIIIILATVGCQSAAPSSADNLAPLMREQTAEMKALREQVTLLQNQVIALKDRPVTSEVTVPASQRKYAMAAGKAPNLGDRDAIYIMHVESGRFIAVALAGTLNKFEVIAGQDIRQAVAVPGRRRAAAPLPSMAKTGDSVNTGFLTTRILDDEEALLVLDEHNHLLLAYRFDVTRKRLQLIAREDLAKVFELIAQ